MRCLVSRFKFDTVFIDAPCSGTGTMRRHPEIPWRLTEKDVTVELPKLQLTMLKEAAARVAAGGELIYATCSVFDEENTQVVDAFLASPEGAGFSVAPLSEAQILQLPEFDQAKKLVSVRQNDRRPLPERARKRRLLRRPLLRPPGPQVTTKLR